MHPVLLLVKTANVGCSVLCPEGLTSGQTSEIHPLEKEPQTPSSMSFSFFKVINFPQREFFFPHFNQGKVMAANIFRAEIGKCDDHH